MTRLEFLQCTWIFTFCKQSHCESTKKRNKSPNVCSSCSTCEKPVCALSPAAHSQLFPWGSGGRGSPRGDLTEPMGCWHRGCVKGRRSWALCRREMHFIDPGEERWSSVFAACELHHSWVCSPETLNFLIFVTALLWDRKWKTTFSRQDRDWEVEIYQVVLS